MTHLDLFSGIGGFAIAAERVWPDIEHVFCEIDPFCRTILTKHWPHAPIYGDIRTLTNTSSQRTGMEKSDSGRQEWKGTNTPQSTLVRQGDGEGNAEGVTAGIDLLTGGFPCQPFSHAGRRKGTNDDRHLWPEMRRVIQEFAPRYVVAENVRGLLSIDGGMVFEQVCLDLEALGYEVQPFVIPACAVNAPHRRDRIWIVAHSNHESVNVGCGRREAAGHYRELDRERPAQKWNLWNENWSQVAARLCRVDDGLPSGMARPRGWRNAALKAYGNAIVPQVAEQIFRTIKYL